MENVKITFNDGTKITAEVNGNSYIVDEKPEFPEDLTDVVIEKNGEEKTIKDARIVECASIDGRYWFAIIEIPEQERILTHLQSSVDYIAMMADIDL